MIVSHKHRFIFIKTKKTAGTSLEIALSRFAGDKDIVTPILPSEDEKIRREVGGVGPQHYLRPMTRYTPVDWLRLLVKRKRAALFYNHIPARVACKRLPDEVWQNYFKFCVERNPWDKVVSAYYGQVKRGASYTLTEFIHSPRLEQFARAGGFDLYAIGGQIAMDKVYRYEALPEAMEDLAARLSLPEPLTLSRAKGQSRPSDTDYHALMGEAERRRIEQVFAREIAHFGYTFN